jgi:hypothetical protein
MNVGLIDVDGKNFPNYALMKISAYHKGKGDTVGWAAPLFPDYDRVYMSKIFNFSPDVFDVYNCEVVRGGTGYDYRTRLPDDIDAMLPDYSIYPQVDKRTAYGFITRGCPNKCPWCVVPKKEGTVTAYRDADEIAEGGRRPNLVLMDNNILASDFGISQLEKIVDRRYRIDLNQAVDARLITDEMARLLARIRWIGQIRLGCDTPGLVKACEEAMQRIDKYRKVPATYLLYAMIGEDIDEAYERLTHWRGRKRVRVAAQPFRDVEDPHQVIPQWQKDMARWAMRREYYMAADFKEFEIRKGFKCSKWFEK